MLTAPEGKSGLRECRGVDRRRADRGDMVGLERVLHAEQKPKPQNSEHMKATKQSKRRHSGMVRKHQTRNLEIPGSMLRIAPE
jgi:hypothetical protein